MVNEDSINHISDGRVHFTEQEMVDEDSVDHVADEGVDLPG